MGDRVSTGNTAVLAFIERWSKSGGAERANYQLFLAELCDVLGVPRPDPTRPDDHENAYVFERNVQFDNLDGTFRSLQATLSRPHDKAGLGNMPRRRYHNHNTVDLCGLPSEIGSIDGWLTGERRNSNLLMLGLYSHACMKAYGFLDC
jgi:hypothetical protein